MRLLSLETIKLGLSNLRLHKLRSLLTSLGIIFGVAAVICMLSISEGASADEMRMIQLLGTFDKETQVTFYRNVVDIMEKQDLFEKCSTTAAPKGEKTAEGGEQIVAKKEVERSQSFYVSV